VNKAASPTNPLVRNSHPAKVSTTSRHEGGGRREQSEDRHDDARDQEKNPMAADRRSDIASDIVDIGHTHDCLLERH
jgi:hypothetical protein